VNHLISFHKNLIESIKFLIQRFENITLLQYDNIMNQIYYLGIEGSQTSLQHSYIQQISDLKPYEEIHIDENIIIVSIEDYITNIQQYIEYNLSKRTKKVMALLKAQKAQDNIDAIMSQVFQRIKKNFIYTNVFPKIQSVFGTERCPVRCCNTLLIEFKHLFSKSYRPKDRLSKDGIAFFTNYFIDFLNECEDITYLDLPYIETKDKIKILTQNKHLTSLTIRNQNIDEYIIALSQMPLKDLKVYNKQLTDDQVVYFANSQTLRSLRIDAIRLTFSGFEALSSSNITSLNLYESNINNRHIDILMNSKTLTSLDVGHNYITDIGAKSLANNKLLKHLNIGHNLLTEDCIPFFVNNDTLESLDIQGNNIEGELIYELIASKSLTYLNLSGYHIDNENLLLSKETTLETLIISNTNVGNKMAMFLGANKRLIYLDMSNNNITDEGLQQLANNTTLTHLDLSENETTEKAADLFINNMNLIYLNISDNEILRTIRENRRQIYLNQKIAFIMGTYNQHGCKGHLLKLANNDMKIIIQSIFSYIPYTPID
jgi:hypothetical protein